MGIFVDTRLRVKAVKGLRCVDASVIPVHISGNVMGSVDAIAGEATDMVLEGVQTDLFLGSPPRFHLQICSLPGREAQV